MITIPSIESEDNSDHSSATVPDIASLISQLKAVERNIPTDDVARKELLDVIRRVGFALEKEGDTVQRICYLVIISSTNKWLRVCC